MDVIKLQKKEECDLCYFFDAGEIEIIPIAQWYGITVVKKNGLPLFKMTMNPSYIEVFGYIIAKILDQESFEFPAGMKSKHRWERTTVVCLDPRVVAYVFLMVRLRRKVFEGRKKTKDITLPMLSTEEAKDFLRKNNLLWENLDEDIRLGWNPNPPEELVGIPDKIKNLLQ